MVLKVNDSDDTVDLKGGDVDAEGEYTEALGRMSSPNIMMDLDVSTTIKPRKPLKQQKSAPLLIVIDSSRISRHGIAIPSLPKELIRNLAQQFSSKPITKDILPSLETIRICNDHGQGRVS